MTKGYKVEGGDRIGKTIVFARNAEHAEFVKQRFDANYPWHAGHSARVVTHQVTYAQSLIDAFADPAKQPDIAISVDMLDTGIDVPEVCNLVFPSASEPRPAPGCSTTPTMSPCRSCAATGS